MRFQRSNACPRQCCRGERALFGSGLQGCHARGVTFIAAASPNLMAPTVTELALSCPGSKGHLELSTWLGLRTSFPQHHSLSSFERLAGVLRKLGGSNFFRCGLASLLFDHYQRSHRYSQSAVLCKSHARAASQTPEQGGCSLQGRPGWPPHGLGSRVAPGPSSKPSTQPCANIVLVPSNSPPTFLFFLPPSLVICFIPWCHRTQAGHLLRISTFGPRS